MSFAPAISKDGFYYNGDLYAEVSDLNRHKRASVAEISAILRPPIKQSRASAQAPTKDPVGHWYEAQLVHYGLAVSKTKAVAKSRLLDALNAGTLAVPAHIARLEEGLKKEWSILERRAKANYKASMGGGAKSDSVGEGVTAGKKRKEMEVGGPSLTVHVHNHFGTPSTTMVTSGGYEPADDQPLAKKPRKAPAKAGEKKTPANHSIGKAMKKTAEESEGPVKKKAIKKTEPVSAPVTQARSSLLGDANTKATPLIKKDCKKEHMMKTKPAVSKVPAVKGEAAAERESATKRESAIKKKPIVKGGPGVKKEPSVKKEPLMKKEPKLKKEPATKKEPKMKVEASSQASAANLYSSPNRGQSSLGLINGTYEIDCPKIAFAYYGGEEICHMSLRLKSPSIWGSFRLGPYEGVLFIPERPYTASAKPLPVSWRCFDEEASNIDAGEGLISFQGDGYIAGMLVMDEEFHFSGTRRTGSEGNVREASEMAEEWDNLVGF